MLACCMRLQDHWSRMATTEVRAGSRRLLLVTAPNLGPPGTSIQSHQLLVPTMFETAAEKIERVMHGHEKVARVMHGCRSREELYQ